ncbi:MAG: hypothetical protein FJ303_22585 [Planctomycetes bacterium]|nr:hypothetical protein [Planctomycetota bacterium]
MRFPPNRQRRGGNVMALCALLLFVIFGVAALTIDIGLAMTARRQMQTATDSSAREGLRYRDEIPDWLKAQIDDPTSDIAKGMAQDGIDTSDKDQVRRWMTRAQINATYADLKDQNNDIVAQFGAGPEFTIDPGQGDANAFQTIHIPKQGDVVVYKPKVQLNLGNEKNGDIVAGTFTDVQGGETADYTRPDFVPASSGDSTLVRLRRTQSPLGKNQIAADNQDGVSTTGKALPLIFGQASLIVGKDPVTGSSPRHDGTKVRSTSIVQARRAMSVGLPRPELNLQGATPFVIDSALWSALPLTPVTPSVAAGTITVPGLPGSGWFVAGAPTSFGQAVPGPFDSAFDERTGFVPIVEAVNDANGKPGLPRVIGFGRVTVSKNDTILMLTKSASQIGPENATVVLTRPLDSLDAAETANLFIAFKNLPEPLLAPALVR